MAQVHPPAGRRNLDYAEITSNITGITATAYGNATGLQVGFTAPVEPIKLSFYSPVVDINTAVKSIFVSIYSSDGASQYIEGAHTSDVAFGSDPMLLERRVTNLTPGSSYGFKVMVKVDGGSGFLKGTPPTGPAYLRADKDD